MAGRPTVRSEEVSSKIEQAAALGASIDEIAFYAGIHRTTLYRWMAEDEELKDRVEELQQQPILKARQTIVKALDNPEQARWYLERKQKKEFSTRVESEVTNNVDATTAEGIRELSDKFDEFYKQQTGSA